MKVTRSRILAYFLPILAIVILTVLLVVTLFRLMAVQREMQVNASANMVWVVYQAHAESLLLGQAIQKKMLSPEDPVDLGFRYNLLLSRVRLFEDGPQARVLEALGVDRDLVRQVAHISELAPVFSSATPQPGQLARLILVLSEFDRLLSVAANRAMLAQWDEAGAQLDKYRQTVFVLLLLMLGIVISSAFISVRLLFALKKSKEAEVMRQREVELKKQLEMERQMREMYRSFGAMVSHQFRTPLAIIDASMQRLIRSADKMDAAEVARRAGKARAATGRLTSLIESLLAADRFLDQVELHTQVCAIDKIITQVIDEHQALNPARTIRFIDEAAGSCRVECDPVLTAEVISNILSNALAYSAADSVVELRVYSQADWGCCDVIDQGRGIRAKDIPYVFNRYFRTWTTADVVGTGIGLHIASELIALQNGEILVRSSPGAGSVFTVRLPLARLSGN